MHALQPCLNGDMYQYRSVADIPTVREVTCQETLD